MKIPKAQHPVMYFRVIQKHKNMILDLENLTEKTRHPYLELWVRAQK